MHNKSTFTTILGAEQMIPVPSGSW